MQGLFLFIRTIICKDRQGRLSYYQGSAREDGWNWLSYSIKASRDTGHWGRGA